MTYEKEIPDYAMVPAKETEERVIIPASKEAVYSSVPVTNVTEKPKTVLTIEEDILVPDTKPDLREILLIDGKNHPISKEISQLNKNEDYVSVSGEIELQTLYLPEKEEDCGPIISVQARVPFKEQWHIGVSQEASLLLDTQIEKIEHMVINERKYRVKISLAIYAREYTDRRVEIFEGLNGEEIQMQREKVEITNIALRKSDTLQLQEDLQLKEECPIDNILRQDIRVIENYKQVTGEKVVVNGFILIHLLYSCREGVEACENLHQAQEKVEFTQFIPIRTDGSCAGSHVCFDGSNLKVKRIQGEDGKEVLRLEGDLLTSVEIYCNIEKEIIVDAYHREKDFLCDFEEEQCRTLVGTTMGESSLREIFSPETQGGELQQILYTGGEIHGGESRCEQGKVVTEGSVLAKLICRCAGNGGNGSSRIFSLTEEIPFRVVTALPQLAGDERIRDQIYLKDFWAEKINGKQIEFNAGVLVTTEVMRRTPLKVLVNPAFEESSAAKRRAPMVIYVAKKNDRLWDIAKKYKTTVETIAQFNQLEDGTLRQGEKLLILK